MSETKTKTQKSNLLNKVLTLQQRIDSAVALAKSITLPATTESKAPTPETPKPFFRANKALRESVSRYNEFAATEKLNKEKRERERDSILAAVGGKECIIVDETNDAKLGTVLNGKKSILDAKRLLGDFPELIPLFAAYQKESDGWQFRP